MYLSINACIGGLLVVRSGETAGMRSLVELPLLSALACQAARGPPHHAVVMGAGSGLAAAPTRSGGCGTRNGGLAMSTAAWGCVEARAWCGPEGCKAAVAAAEAAAAALEVLLEAAAGAASEVVVRPRSARLMAQENSGKGSDAEGGGLAR